MTPRWLLVIAVASAACRAPDHSAQSAPPARDSAASPPRPTRDLAAATVTRRLGRDSCPGDSATGAWATTDSGLAAERREFAAAPHAVSRSGRDLLVELADGGVARLRDCYSDGDLYISYRYAGFLQALATHLIDVGYYEGHAILLLGDRHWGAYRTYGLPVLSPDSAHFATSAIDVESTEDPNSLEVWRVAADTLVREFDIEPDGQEWGPSSPRWVSPTVLEFWRVLGQQSDSAGDSSKAYLVQRGGTWSLETTAP